MIRRYFSMLIQEGYRDAPGKMKQFASWFTHGVQNGSHLRKVIYDAHDENTILSEVERFFEEKLGKSEATSSAAAAAQF